MSDRQLDDEVLRRAFQGLAGSSSGECTPEDLGLVWKAVAGDLPPAQRRDLVERLATDPALAEAWRVAHELRPATPVAIAPERRRAPWWSTPWLAAAAVLLLAAAVVFVARRDRSDVDTMRNAGSYVLESLVTSDAALPGDAFQLRWTPGPQGARYQVRVTTEDLRVLTTAADLTEPALLVDRALLAKVTPGARVFWQVEVALPTGERVASPTFVQRVR